MTRHRARARLGASIAGLRAASEPRPTGRRAAASAREPAAAVALALAVGYVGAGRRARLLAGRRGPDADQRPAQPARPRRRPRGAARPHLRRAGSVLARNVGGPNGEPLREYPYPGRWRRSSATRACSSARPGLERTYDAQLTGLRHARARATSCCASSATDPYDPSDLLPVARPATCSASAMRPARRPSAARSSPSSRRPDAILALRQQPDVRPEPARRPGRPGGATWPTLREQPTDSPLLDRATQGLYVPGLGVQDRDRDRRPGSGAINGRDDLRGPAGRVRRRASWSMASASATAPRRSRPDHPLDFYEATEVSSNIWFAHAGPRHRAPRRWSTGRRGFGFGAAHPFELPTSPSQVNGGDGPLDGFATTSSWPTRRTARPRCSSTPLQMALVAATVANDGALMRPKLVDGCAPSDGDVVHDRLAQSAGRRCIGADDGADHRRRDGLAVEGPFGAGFAGGGEGARRDDRGQERHGRARRRRGAAQLVHRLRAGRRTAHRDRGHRRERRRRQRSARCRWAAT